MTERQRSSLHLSIDRDLPTSDDLYRLAQLDNLQKHPSIQVRARSSDDLLNKPPFAAVTPTSIADPQTDVAEA